jgi:hypothetical protein
MVHGGFPEFHVVYKIFLCKIFDKFVSGLGQGGDGIGDVNAGCVVAAIFDPNR